MKLRALALSALPFLLAAASAHAVDGVTMINQAKALAGNVTPGDAPGFPVTISRPGSYRLSGSLTVADAPVAAVQVTAGNVTLDLNGYTISGPRCGTAGCVASFDAGSVGIRLEAPFVTVRNGTIDAFLGHGVLGSSQVATLEDLTLRRHAYGASLAGSNSLLRCVLAENRAADVYLSGRSVIRHSRFLSGTVSAISQPQSASALLDGNYFYGNSPVLTLNSSLGNNVCFSTLC